MGADHRPSMAYGIHGLAVCLQGHTYYWCQRCCMQDFASISICGCVPAGLFISGFLAPVPALLVLSSIKLHQLSARSELS